MEHPGKALHPDENAQTVAKRDDKRVVLQKGAVAHAFHGMIYRLLSFHVWHTLPLVPESCWLFVDEHTVCKFFWVCTLFEHAVGSRCFCRQTYVQKAPMETLSELLLSSSPPSGFKTR